MAVKFCLLCFPLSLLLFLIRTPFAAAILCWELNAIEGGPRYPTIEINGNNVVSVAAADCLHIISVLPESLHCDPALSDSHKKLTYTFGRLIKHRFDLPAYVRYKSCEVRINAVIREHPASPDRDFRPFTRKECAYYIWNLLKAELEAIVRTCPTGCGYGSVPEDQFGMPENMGETKNMVTVYPAGMLTDVLGEGHLYEI